jgi:hypothetical protein
MTLLYFIGGHEADGPLTLRKWKSVMQVVNGIVGLQQAHRLFECVVDLFIDTSETQKATTEGTKWQFELRLSGKPGIRRERSAPRSFNE